MSTKIMIIRHGEKPSHKKGGFLLNGEVSIDGLTIKGWQRAGAITRLFRSSIPGLCAPIELHACYKSKHAQRALDTITPLANMLGLDVNTKFKKGEEVDLAHAAMSTEGPVLISWENTAIHEIGNAIMGDEESVPQVWPKDRFDMVYVFDYIAGKWEFSMIPQMLLAGDSAKLFD